MSNSIEQNKKENDLETSDNATSPVPCDAPVDSSNTDGQDEYDQAIEDKLLSMMKEQPAKLLMYFLSILCNEMVKTNADTLELSQHMDCEGKRYKVSCKAKNKVIGKAL